MRKNLLPIISILILLTSALVLADVGIFQRTGLAFLQGKLLFETGKSEKNTQDEKKWALKDLIDILDYPLDEEAVVPRIELAKLPDAYTDIIDPKQRKSLFLRLLLPLVLLENEELEKVRSHMNVMLGRIELGEKLRGDQIAKLDSLCRQYDIKGDPLRDPEARRLLRRRVDVVPPSLALAQAATESGWGNSRFAREAGNLFGIWTFNKDKGVMPEERDLNEKHLVRKFDNLRDSVHVYMHTLNTHPAYAELRAIRYQLKEKGMDLSGTVVAEGLIKYSILGEGYVRLIQEVITINNLESLNSVKLQTI